MAMAISELTGYFYGIKYLLYMGLYLSTYNWYNLGHNYRRIREFGRVISEELRMLSNAHGFSNKSDMQWLK